MNLKTKNTFEYKMKIVRKFYVDDKEVTQKEYDAAFKKDELHSFKIVTTAEPETLQDRVVQLEKTVKELQKENENLKSRVLSLEIMKDITISRPNIIEPNTTPYPWQNPIIYCTDTGKTVSCTSEYKLTTKN